VVLAGRGRQAAPFDFANRQFLAAGAVAANGRPQRGGASAHREVFHARRGGRYRRDRALPAGVSASLPPGGSGYYPGLCPEAAGHHREAFLLPLFPAMSDDVIAALDGALGSQILAGARLMVRLSGSSRAGIAKPHHGV